MRSTWYTVDYHGHLVISTVEDPELTYICKLLQRLFSVATWTALL